MAKLKYLLIGVLLISIVFISGCKTFTTIFTAVENCKEFKSLESESFNDPYDKCVGEFTTKYDVPSECQNLCLEFCAKNNFKYDKSEIVAEGCKCICR